MLIASEILHIKHFVRFKL